MKNFGIDQLEIQDIINITQGKEQIILNDEAKAKITQSQKNVAEIVASDRTVYGINTGFGPLCDTKISDEETAQLQHNLIISHSVGV